MSTHRFDCHLTWTGASRGPTADYASYSREFRLEVDGKPALVGSAAAAFRGDRALYNPEDLLVAALASCHCLSYLALAARARILVVAYEDAAHGQMEVVAGVMRFVDVLLRPTVTLARDSDAARALELHGGAHAGCFIASSVNFPVRHEPTILTAVP
jgi:organic hydroperoxide reductase OsmC/OhrA